MRANAMRALLERGDVSVGTFLNFPDPGLVEFTGHRGFDWILFDAEHEGVGVPECYDLVRAADAVGLATVVRVPLNSPDVLLAYAESGASALLAPHISSGDAARLLVSSLSFPPLGDRGVSINSRAANYGLTQSPAEYLAAADQHTIPMALLEDDMTPEDLDGVLEVAGLDVFAIGPGDLAASMGLPGQGGHPRVVERVEYMADRLRSAGKTLCYPCSGPADAEAAFALGARMLVTSNAGLLGRAMAEYLAGVRALHPSEQPA
jgi:2-keto-3-deoxy-L-rhamnonate aldolase RhmA